MIGYINAFGIYTLCSALAIPLILFVGRRARRVGYCHPERSEGPLAVPGSSKSAQVGIPAAPHQRIFLERRQPLISFSRAIASSMY